MARPPRTGFRRLAILIGLLGLLAGAIALAMSNAGTDPDAGSAARSAPVSGAGSAIDRRFAALSKARTNRCDLGAAELRRMPGHMRLRGSCCFPMDRAGYEEQLRDLRGYDRRLVPRDPYDIPVSMAKRLLSYRDLPLDARERAAYRRATAISELGGPCCCPCWRWEAFKGQARFLLARRGFSAEEVAQLWEHEEGCGGSHEHA